MRARYIAVGLGHGYGRFFPAPYTFVLRSNRLTSSAALQATSSEIPATPVTCMRVAMWNSSTNVPLPTQRRQFARLFFLQPTKHISGPPPSLVQTISATLNLCCEAIQ